MGGACTYTRNKSTYIMSVEFRYCIIKPSGFQIGDVVEITIAFVILPVRDERYIMVPQLRVVMLLNDQIRQVTRMNSTQQKHKTYTMSAGVQPGNQGGYQLQKRRTLEM